MIVDGNGKIPINLGWLVNSSNFSYCFQLSRGSLVLFSQGNSPMAITAEVLTVHELAVWKPWLPKLGRTHLVIPEAMPGLPARHPLPKEKYGTRVWKAYKMAFKCWIKRTEIFLALHSELKGFDSGIFLWQCLFLYWDSVFLPILDIVINNPRILLHF